MAAMSRMQKNVQRLIDERDRLRAELAAFTATITGRISGLESAIALLQHDGDEPTNQMARRQDAVRLRPYCSISCGRQARRA